MAKNVHTPTPAAAAATKAASLGVETGTAAAAAAPRDPPLPDALPADAPGERTADERTGQGQYAADARVAAAQAEAVGRAMSPPAADAPARRLPAVAPWGTKGMTAPERGAYDPAFDRRYTMDTLVRHPVAEVRQRAEEAQAAMHHGAPDAGLKMRAAMDVARRAERTR